MIELDNISFAYPGAGPLFDDFSWRVEPGEQWSVVGPSGCGKTTLLMLLTGLLSPQAGRITIDGEPLQTPLAENGLVFQDYGLLPWATIRENVELGLRIRMFNGCRSDRHGPLNRRSIRERAQQSLERLGLAAVAERFPARVSGGQRQRAAIARTLATDARRLFMDEPFAALDAPSREALRRETLQLCREQELSMVLVTHSIEEAVLMGQKILAFGNARPVAPRMVENAHERDTFPRNDEEWQQRCDAVRGLLT